MPLCFYFIVLFTFTVEALDTFSVELLKTDWVGGGIDLAVEALDTFSVELLKTDWVGGGIDLAVAVAIVALVVVN